MKQVTIYSDGACSGNPGPGGWGTILIYGELEKELSGYEGDTTNNRMELLGAIYGLEALNQPCEVKLYSDSAYLCNAINQNWLYNWQRNGFIKKDKKPVENVDLWKRIIAMMEKHRVTFIKVKGHADNAYNNRCDALARGAIAEYRKSLQKG
ncbi:MAG: ribonuclease HI [Clostridiales bacterium]|nr:ribonuclease HI [Clostridiales bacterium]